MNEKQILALLRKIGAHAEKCGFKAWAVGGFARDRILGRKTFDIDICAQNLSARKADIKPLADFCSKLGAQVKYFDEFGTARASFNGGLKIDFVLCRREVYPAAAALPIVEPAFLEDDLFRRDFTANALALSLQQNEFLQPYDYYNAQEAVKKGYIKILHGNSFIDDPTRILRALRFAARFDWPLEKNTEILLKEAVKSGALALLSRERLSAEVMKTLQEEYPSRIFKLFQKYGISDYIYKGLRYPACIDEIKLGKKTDDENKKNDIMADRLTLFALGQGSLASAEEFLRSLKPSRDIFCRVYALCAFYYGGEAAQKPLSARQKKLLKIFNPSLNPCELKTAFLSGGALSALGASGPQIGILQKTLGRAQRRGVILSRAAAVKTAKKMLAKL